ncbi:MAG TPA: LLM class flavin-dependent oxidoreductase [Actinomycetota bacterium]|jgi:alkanesulfonate monooxygenase SsuD/methylene tetrahydromethanopterin reductase-like flavin-dependent oxidoreductase (luciferase family)|nr:LLM class flavin-dependent oxidoreductase [Actinomycetota bacterium]
MLPMAESDSTFGRGASGGQIWSEALAFARHAEAIGLDSIWPCDHFLSEAPGGPVEGILEGWTVLSALAAVTDRVELGQMVMCVSYREPGLLAKMASTAQAVSGGRVVLGVGAGWYDREYQAFGYPIDHRVDRFEEALQIIVPLVRGDSVSFDGRYYTTRDAALLPPPAPSIPVLVAAKGSRMLRLTARYADAWNTAWFGTPTDELMRRVGDLDSALQAEGRDPHSLRRTVGMTVRDPDQTTEEDPNTFGGSVDELAGTIDAYEKIGFDDIIAGVEPMTERSLDRLGQAMELRRR